MSQHMKQRRGIACNWRHSGGQLCVILFSMISRKIVDSWHEQDAKLQLLSPIATREDEKRSHDMIVILRRFCKSKAKTCRNT